jgi:hypothetical protein
VDRFASLKAGNSKNSNLKLDRVFMCSKYSVFLKIKMKLDLAIILLFLQSWVLASVPAYSGECRFTGDPYLKPFGTDLATRYGIGSYTMFQSSKTTIQVTISQCPGDIATDFVSNYRECISAITVTTNGQTQSFNKFSVTAANLAVQEAYDWTTNAMVI